MTQGTNALMVAWGQSMGINTNERDLVSVSSRTNPGISTHVAELIQSMFMVPLDLHVNEKMYNSTPLNGTCFVELKDCYKGIQGDTFQVQFCPDTFALMCESSDMRPE